MFLFPFYKNKKIKIDILTESLQHLMYIDMIVPFFTSLLQKTDIKSVGFDPFMLIVTESSGTKCLSSTHRVGGSTVGLSMLLAR